MANKNVSAILNDNKIEIKCALKKSEHYALKIPTLGFHASTRTGVLGFTKDGVSTTTAVGDELGLEYKLISIKDKKIVAEGKIELATKVNEKAKAPKRNGSGK